MRNLFVLNVVIAFTSWQLHAQPCFSPTITSPRLGYFNNAPNSVNFCDNNDTEILATQAYDTYQWYRQEWAAVPPGTPNPNPWIAIQGANSQTYTINGTDDMLYYFKVVATLDSCTEESPAILADGYAFGLPYLIATFQPGTYQYIGYGTYNVCNGASVLLANGFPYVYGLHTWYRCMPSAIPPVPGDTCIIQGATGDTIIATESGFYGFYSCTDYCPHICLFLVVPNFITLLFGYFSFCTLVIDEPTTSNNLLLYPNPTIQLLYLGKPNDEYNADILITDMMGKEVITIENYDYAQPIDVSNLPSGSYIIISKSGSGRIASNKFIKK
jgi:hypothetical protein